MVLLKISLSIEAVGLRRPPGTSLHLQCAYGFTIGADCTTHVDRTPTNIGSGSVRGDDVRAAERLEHELKKEGNRKCDLMGLPIPEWFDSTLDSTQIRDGDGMLSR